MGPAILSFIQCTPQTLSINIPTYFKTFGDAYHGCNNGSGGALSAHWSKEEKDKNINVCICWQMFVHMILHKECG